MGKGKDLIDKDRREKIDQTQTTRRSQSKQIQNVQNKTFTQVDLSHE
jgi:hypothetical protein